MTALNIVIPAVRIYTVIPAVRKRESISPIEALGDDKKKGDM